MKFTSIQKLKPGMMLGQSILGITQAEKYIIGTVLTEKDIDFLGDKGIFGVYTMETKAPEILSPELMLRCLTAFQKKDIDTMLSLSEQIVIEVTARTEALDFRSIRSYEDYLPHHSICVAVYAVATGMRLGMTDAQLNNLALAGLLHDIGKTHLDSSILMKKETLTPEEYEQIKHHSEEGYTMLKPHPRIPTTVLEGILHHHENINGTGYPAGQTEISISPIARILHVVDVYDAIMSTRPYKRGMSGADAINYLIGGKMILFDARIVDAFLEVAIPYPTGCEVLLSNNQTALVVKQSKNTHRPFVFIDSEQSLIDLSLDNKYQDIIIVSDTDYERNLEKQAASAATTGEILTNPNHSKKKILIVDDVFVSIAHTKRALVPDYDVITCQDGAKAARMVATEKPDLVLMDYEMPNLNGISALQEIRKHGFQTPIVFLTGKCDKETVKTCLHYGAADYILKPANPVYLRARVEMILHNIDKNVFL